MPIVLPAADIAVHTAGRPALRHRRPVVMTVAPAIGAPPVRAELQHGILRRAVSRLAPRRREPRR